MTQVLEAYEQVKKHIFFIITASQQKLVKLNARMNSANKEICYAEVIKFNMHSVRTTMVYTMHNGTSTYTMC